MAKSVSMEEISLYFGLESLTPAVEQSSIRIDNTEINRPALQLAGFYTYFNNDRIQLYGRVEDAYMNTKTKEEQQKSTTAPSS